MELPEDILREIADWVSAADKWSDPADRKFELSDLDCRRTFANMRLSSKALCKVASPKLFQHIVAVYSDKPESSPVEKLRQICDSPYASYVRQVNVGIPWTRPPPLEMQIYLEDLVGLLPSLVHKLPNLYSLGFKYKSELHLPVQARTLISSSIVPTLHYIELPNLKELDLCFPTTFDFGQLHRRSKSRIPVEVVCQQLRHLGLTVQNYTSQAGGRYWPNRVLSEDKPFENEPFASNLHRLVEAAKNLNSLTICCSNPLDFDNVIFPLRLRDIRLYRVIVSSKTVSSIFNNFDAIRSVQLYGVELKAGTWQRALMNLAQSSAEELIEFYMDSCGYSLTGASSHFHQGLLPEPDNPISIETRNYSDFTALFVLYKSVIKNRITQQLPKVSTYEKAELFSMESLMASLAERR